MNENTLMVTDEGFIGELTSRTSMFCSMNAETPEEKAKLFNAMNNPDKRIADEINTVIKAKDLFCEVVELMKRDESGNPITDDSGEVVTSKCPRVVIVDDKGVGHQCVSLGIFSAMKKIIAIYGPPTWETPIALKVTQITKGTRKLLTLNVAM